MPKTDPLAAARRPVPDPLNRRAETGPRLDPRLAGVLRQALSHPAGSTPGPTARLLRGGASAIGGDRPLFQAPGGATAMQLLACLGETRKLANLAEAGRPFSKQALQELQHVAPLFEADAEQAVAAAELAAQEAPQNLALRQVAFQARHNARHVHRSASQLSAVAARTWRVVGETAVGRIRDSARQAVKISNGATREAVELLRSSSGNLSSAEVLLQMDAPDAASLLSRNHVADDAAFFRAAMQAVDGDPRTMKALTTARGLRTEAVNAASAERSAEGALAVLKRGERESASAARTAGVAFQGEDMAAVTQASAKAAAAALSSEATLPALQDSHLDLRHIRIRMDRLVRAALQVRGGPAAGGAAMPTAKGPVEASPLLVQEQPAGVPGEMVIGGTVVEIDPVADAAVGAAGAQAGKAARRAVDAAVARHGAGSRGALDPAVHEGTLAQAQALASAMLKHPHLATALKLGGKALGAAALAAVTYQLGEAIHTDVKNGDRSAPATRKVLEELLGGTALGIGGAAVGARVGVALGSLAGPVSAAVGGFIGGLFGGALGYAAGAKLVDEAIAAEKQPLAHWIDGLVAGAAPKHDGAAIVKASDSVDDHVNAKELRRGLEVLGLETDIGERQLAALINAYGSRGVGALSPADLDRALADGALRIDDQNRVTAEPLEFTLNLDTAGQEGRAANIAKRLVNLGSSEDGDDRRLNTRELMDALEDAGCNRSIDEGRFARLVAAYGQSGEGALSEAEIAQAIQDGALEFDAQGGVFVHDQAATGMSGNGAENIALRIVQAGSSDGLLANADELKDGMKAAGFDPRLGKADWQALIANPGDSASGVIGPEGLGRAIAEGDLGTDANGGVTARKRALP